jgi:hypothetical protein
MPGTTRPCACVRMKSDVRGVVQTVGASAAISSGFIKSDLDVLFTFCDVARTRHEVGFAEDARDILAKAQKGYDDLYTLFTGTRGLPVNIEQEFETSFLRLREVLNSLRPCALPPSEQ